MCSTSSESLRTKASREVGQRTGIVNFRHGFPRKRGKFEAIIDDRGRFPGASEAGCDGMMGKSRDAPQLKSL